MEHFVAMQKASQPKPSPSLPILVRCGLCDVIHQNQQEHERTPTHQKVQWLRKNIKQFRTNKGGIIIHPVQFDRVTPGHQMQRKFRVVNTGTRPLILKSVVLIPPRTELILSDPMSPQGICEGKVQLSIPHGQWDITVTCQASDIPGNLPIETEALFDFGSFKIARAIRIKGAVRL